MDDIIMRFKEIIQENNTQFIEIFDENDKLLDYNFANIASKLSVYYSKFFGSLSKKEIKLLHTIITHGKIELINRNIDTLSNKHQELATKYIDIVSKAKLPFDITVWRGGPGPKFKKGTQHLSKYFLSTSLSPLVAFSYMRRFSNDWLYQIIIPKNTPALYFGRFLDKAIHEDEEITLLAGTSMQIVDVERRKKIKLVYAYIK